MAQTTTVKTKESKSLRALIMEAAQEILSDPDFGLELSEKTKTRLRKEKVTPSRKTLTLKEIEKKYL